MILIFRSDLLFNLPHTFKFSQFYKIQNKFCMYCINYRVGILFKQNLTKKSYELRYFFIDDQANLFHIPSLARLQKIIRLSSDFKQIKQKLIKFGEKSFPLNKYTLTNPHSYSSEAVIPFSNRTCFQIKPIEKKMQQGKQMKSYQIFGFVDQDTPLLHFQIEVLTGKKKVELVKRKSVIQDQKNKQQKKLAEFFNTYLQNQQKFKMQNLRQQEDQKDQQEEEKEEKEKKQVQIQFIGQKVQGKAQGRCSQTFIPTGLSYTGQFFQGKKHGQGLLVSAELDSLSCQFFQDQVVGI